ncbi:MAG: DUF983 domain-containing protein [Pseudomonadota bacterium]
MTTDAQTYPNAQPVRNDRNVKQAMARGSRSRCPNCGEPGLFSSYLKVKDQCGNCGEELHHQRADDFPPYLTIFIVGHIVVALVLIVERSVDISFWAHMAMWIPLTIVLSLLLLPPLKGATVGLQWALRMHGFGGESDDR